MSTPTSTPHDGTMSSSTHADEKNVGHDGWLLVWEVVCGVGAGSDRESLWETSTPLVSVSPPPHFETQTTPQTNELPPASSPQTSTRCSSTWIQWRGCIFLVEVGGRGSRGSVDFKSTGTQKKKLGEIFRCWLWILKFNECCTSEDFRMAFSRNPKNPGQIQAESFEFDRDFLGSERKLF